MEKRLKISHILALGGTLACKKHTHQHLPTPRQRRHHIPIPLQASCSNTNRTNHPMSIDLKRIIYFEHPPENTIASLLSKMENDSL